MPFCGIFIPYISLRDKHADKIEKRISPKIHSKWATNNSQKYCKIRIYALNSHKYETKTYKTN